MGRMFDLAETECIPVLWKPNWRVTASWKDHKVTILVDGMDASYYVACDERMDRACGRVGRSASRITVSKVA